MTCTDNSWFWEWLSHVWIHNFCHCLFVSITFHQSRWRQSNDSSNIEFNLPKCSPSSRCPKKLRRGKGLHKTSTSAVIPQLRRAAIRCSNRWRNPSAPDARGILWTMTVFFTKRQYNGSICECSSWPDNVYIEVESQEREDVCPVVPCPDIPNILPFTTSSSEIRHPRILEKKKKTQLNLW